MLKLLASLGLGAALLLGVAADASANPWRAHGPVFRPAPVVVAPVYRAPVYPAPVYVAPPRVVYAPVYQPVYRPVYAPVYRPVYAPVHHHPWVRPYGHRF